MRENLKKKYSREFLKKDFPENIFPLKKLIKKDKCVLQDKNLVLKKTKKRIERFKQIIQRKSKPVLKVQPTINKVKKSEIVGNSFLFSYDQITNDFLRLHSQNRPVSEFLVKLKERKKFSLLYGNISKKFFEKAYLQALKEKGTITKNLITQFETRLDVVLFRICFAKTIASARQYINHNFITINGTKTNISSYQVKPGDILAVENKKIVHQHKKILKKNVNKRYARFLFSLKLVKTFFYNSKKEPFGTDKHNKVKVFQEPQKNISTHYSNIKIKTLKGKIKRFFFTKKRNRRKSIWYLEILALLHHLQEKPQKIRGKSQKWTNLQKEKRQDFLNIKVKNLLVRKYSRYHRHSAFKISSMKPIHIEVSFKIMTAIILYTPQKIVYPAIFNLDLLSRSLAMRKK